ncbi:MAG: FlgD immunoglobulin-like domain containing protein [bacterium]
MTWWSGIRVMGLMVLVVVGASSAADGYWLSNGNPVCTETGEKGDVRAIADGAGGAIIVWVDRRSGNDDIYAQRIGVDGLPLWTPGGIVVCSANGAQWQPQVASDGNGGVIIAWEDSRGSTGVDIFAQRIDAVGAVQWSPGGEPVCTEPNDQTRPALVPDGSGGIILAWTDDRTGAGTQHVYAQMVDTSGSAQWTSQGEAVCTSPALRSAPAIVTDGGVGAIIGWIDFSTGVSYVQRINGSGAPLWATGGITLTASPTLHLTLVMVPDGSGGVIAAWAQVGPVDPFVYAQRIDGTGAYQWNLFGELVRFLENGGLLVPELKAVSDDANGAIIAWRDHRNPGDDGDIYAQRISDQGALLWDASGVVVAVAPQQQWSVEMSRDGSGGAILAWEDQQNGEAAYAQAIDASGVSRWGADGIAVSTLGAQRPVITEGPHPILAWTDHRDGVLHVYAGVAGASTPVGSGVPVVVQSEMGQTATLTFDNVTVAGITTMTPAESCGSSGLMVIPGACFDLITSATFTGDVEICYYYEDSSLPGPESDLQLKHFDATLSPPDWVDVTTTHDLVGNVICGIVSSFSPFALGTPAGTAVSEPQFTNGLALGQNRPNPVSHETTIEYQIPSGGADVTLAVYDAAGRLVRTLLDGHREAGIWSSQWNGDDERGQRVAPGVYFYRMRTDSRIESRRMLLAR